MRIIDADALIDELMQRCCNNCIKRMGIKNGKQRMIYEIGDAPCKACEVDDIKVELDDAPTIEAEPVRHGHWIKGEKIYPDILNDTTYGYWCSECHHADVHGDNVEVLYCWHCGCKMDEVNDV